MTAERYNPLSASLDEVWAGGNQYNDRDQRFSNYYDYYFSGEDVKVYIDGLFEPKHELDIVSFAYNVRQEKQPLYGFWSYNFDTVLLGTRIISGEFTVYTRHPRRMTDLLEEAAKVRSNSASIKAEKNNVISSLRSKQFKSLSAEGKIVTQTAEDDKNVEKYWAYSQLDRITSDPFTQNVVDSSHNIFSAHPPFNFVVLYGAQEASLSPNSYSSSVEDKTVDNLDRMMVTDTNERLLKIGGIASPMKVILQEVHLTSMSTMYSAGGQPIAENYQFMARDYYLTEADLGFIKKLTATVTSESEESKRDPAVEGYGTNQS